MEGADESFSCEVQDLPFLNDLNHCRQALSHMEIFHVQISFEVMRSSLQTELH